jgi:molecular chaperone GrpE
MWEAAAEAGLAEALEQPAEAAVAAAGAPAEAAPAEAPAPTVEALAADVERLQAEAAEYLDGWQRARAEFANYKKRIDREQDETRARAAGEILSRFIGILDDFERAFKDRPQQGEAAAWANGIDLIYTKLMAILEAQGVQTIEAEGQLFDPNFHEALTHEHSDNHQEGQIIEVIHHGYKLGDRVLRPALVRVAK